jgi:hypothetical protein
MGKGSKVDETEQERALAEIAAQRFNRYREVFAPLEDQYIQQVFDVRNQSNYETAGGIAAAQFQKEFQTGQDKLTDQMFQQGVDPSSGAFQENSAALRRAQAVGQGLGVSGAKVANTDRFYQGLRGVMAIGQGQSADAIEGMAGLARQSGERATAAAESAFERSSAIRSGVASGLGYAAAPAIDSRLQRPRSTSPTFSGTTNTTGG